MRKLNIKTVERHLVDSIQKYFKKAGFTQALIGLSGGVDSAVVAALTIRALGAENVRLVTMPSSYTSQETLQSVADLSVAFGIKVETINIMPLVNIAQSMFEWEPAEADVPAQNLQARVRGLILMSLANRDGRLVMATGNRSENLTGYCTLYGDTVGAIEPIGMLYKTEVYQLAKQLGLPESTLALIPSAELAPGQTDEKELLPYVILDKLLMSWEAGDDEATIARKAKVSKHEVERIIRRIGASEFKRLQTAPSVKLSKGCIR